MLGALTGYFVVFYKNGFSPLGSSCLLPLRVQSLTTKAFQTFKSPSELKPSLLQSSTSSLTLPTIRISLAKSSTRSSKSTRGPRRR
jgi:hypothetical protein